MVADVCLRLPCQKYRTGGKNCQACLTGSHRTRKRGDGSHDFISVAFPIMASHRITIHISAHLFHLIIGHFHHPAIDALIAVT